MYPSTSDTSWRISTESLWLCLLNCLSYWTNYSGTDCVLKHLLDQQKYKVIIVHTRKVTEAEWGFEVQDPIHSPVLLIILDPGRATLCPWTGVTSFLHSHEVWERPVQFRIKTFTCNKSGCFHADWSQTRFCPLHSFISQMFFFFLY